MDGSGRTSLASLQWRAKRESRLDSCCDSTADVSCTADSNCTGASSSVLAGSSNFVRLLRHWDNVCPGFLQNQSTTVDLKLCIASLLFWLLEPLGDLGCSPWEVSPNGLFCLCGECPCWYDRGFQSCELSLKRPAVWMATCWWTSLAASDMFNQSINIFISDNKVHSYTTTVSDLTTSCVTQD